MAIKSLLKHITVVFCLLTLPVMMTYSPAIAQIIELTVNDHSPAASNIAEAWDYWGKWVEEKGNGKLKLNIHHGGVLLKGNEAYRGITTGVVDIAHYVIDRKDGFLLSTITAQPFLGLPDQKKAGLLYYELLKNVPEMMAEWKGVKIISQMQMPPSHIHTSKIQVKTPQDLKGLKIFTPEVAVSESIAAMGGVPVHMDIADMYMSVDRNLVDGLMLHFPVCFVFGVLELTPYHTVFGDGGINMTPQFAIMNEGSFNRLPPDMQKVIEESGPIWAAKQLELDLEMQKMVVDQCKERNDTFINLTNQDVSKWRELVKGPVHEKWIKQAEDKGLPGRKVYNETLRLIEKYSSM